MEDFKNFASWNIKYDMLKNAKNDLEYNGKIINQLFDIASGRGNDLSRWIKLKIPYVIGLEYDKSQFNEAIKRYKAHMSRSNRQNQLNRQNQIKVSYVNGSAVVYNDVVNAIKRKKVNLITNNFAINYFLETEKHFETFLSAVSDSLEIGGLFIGTGTDGDIIEKLMRDNDALNSNKVECLTKLNILSSLFYDIKMINDKKYSFRLNSEYFKDLESGEERFIEEYILKKNYFVKKAMEFNLLPYSIRDNVKPLFNFIEYPLNVNYYLNGINKIYPDQITDRNQSMNQLTPVFYNRNNSLAGLYFGFSFIKVSSAIIKNIKIPRVLIIIPHEFKKLAKKITNKDIFIVKGPDGFSMAINNLIKEDNIFSHLIFVKSEEILPNISTTLTSLAMMNPQNYETHYLISFNDVLKLKSNRKLIEVDHTNGAKPFKFILNDVECTKKKEVSSNIFKLK